mgnify:CR=1 FL=1
MIDIAFLMAVKALKELKKIKTNIGEAVKEYLSEHPVETLLLDKNLEKDNLAADAKATGDALKKKVTGEGIELSVSEEGVVLTYDDGK